MDPATMMALFSAAQSMGGAQGGQGQAAQQPKQSPFFQPEGNKSGAGQVMQSTPPTNYDSMIRSMLQQRRGF